MIIAYDLDDTILDSPRILFNLHNKLNKNNKIEYQNIELEWNFKPIINTDEELAKMLKLFEHKDFYKDVIIFDNTKEIINEFSNNNKTYIISKHSEGRKQYTKEWVAENLPKVELIFVDNFEDKGKILQELGVDVIVDDRVDALMGCYGLVPYRICYGDYTWNRNWVGLRATDWKQLYSMIKIIENTIKSNKLI